jgi:hypothetical protein
MTSTRTQSSATTSTPLTLRITRLLALLSGGALVVDTVTIAVINRHFDPLDSILFLAGFVGLWGTAIALAAYLSAGRSGSRRVLVAVAAFVAIVAVLGAISVVFDQLGRRLFSASNIGLHGEWSFFSIGVCLLVLAAWAAARPRSATGRVSR